MCRVQQRSREPRTTLQDRITEKVVHGTKPGPLPYLNKAKEFELVEFIEVISDLGFSRTQKVATEKGVLKKNRISDDRMIGSVMIG